MTPEQKQEVDDFRAAEKEQRESQMRQRWLLNAAGEKVFVERVFTSGIYGTVDGFGCVHHTKNGEVRMCHGLNGKSKNNDDPKWTVHGL